MIYMYIYIAADWNLEPDFGNLPYPEKVTGTNRSDLGKIDKIYDIFTFCETPLSLLLNVPQILKTGVHLQFQKISVWPIWLLIDPL